jgi:hypothetical protein
MVVMARLILPLIGVVLLLDAGAGRGSGKWTRVSPR